MNLTTTLSTPDGPFALIANQAGAVLASGWTDDAASLLLLVHPTLRPAKLRPVTPVELEPSAQAVRDYYSGDLAAPSRIVVLQSSGSFREAVWGALRQVGPGQTVCYRELAGQAGRPAAVRAAASACARNAVPLFIPCHRVLRSDGSLGGFRYGIDLKRRLLERELNSSH